MWSEDHALAWHLEEKFRQDSAAWALDKCVAWDQLEKELPNFLSEIIDCPCTLAQARADTGRFHVSVQKLTFSCAHSRDHKTWFIDSWMKNRAELKTTWLTPLA